jgi:hypothetical protein
VLSCASHAGLIRIVDRLGMHDISSTHDGPVEVAALLLFVQGAIAVALAFEAVGAAIIFGGASGISALLTVVGAVATLVLVARLRKRRASTRRWVMALQVGWVVLATVDLGLALALAGRGLTPTGFLVRMVLPGAIFWLLRRPAARAEFRDGAAVVEPVDKSRELEDVLA